MFNRRVTNGLPFSRIDLTPLIGLLCALLVLFALMRHDTVSSSVIAPISEAGLGAVPQRVDLTPVELVLDGAESFYWAGTHVDRRQLSLQLDALSALPERKEIFIRPRGSTTYSQLVDILAMLDRRALSNRSFVSPEN